jgi:Mce-associated membrane protein
VTTSQRWLSVAVVALLVVAVLGGALVVRTRHDRTDARARQEQYGAVLAAADAEATAFVNLRADRAAATVDAVAAGATGAFRTHYATDRDRVIAVLRHEQSSMTGRVVWSAVSDLGAGQATVLVATSGTVTNRRTHGTAQPRAFRLRLTLVQQGGRWLTANVQFVGVGT